MKSNKEHADRRLGTVVALSLAGSMDPNRDARREDQEPNDPSRRHEGIDPSIPTEGEDGHQGPDRSPDDLEQQFPENPDERREDRERGGDSPLDDMTIPKDPNGVNVG